MVTLLIVNCNILNVAEIPVGVLEPATHRHHQAMTAPLL